MRTNLLIINNQKAMLLATLISLEQLFYFS
nr:MAG TPA: hypothetical protein [Caudoviricetes sp.]